MRELDLLLSKFLNEHYDNLSDVDRSSFDALLDCTDDQLFRWLTTRTYPEEPRLSGIITTITMVRGEA